MSWLSDIFGSSDNTEQIQFQQREIAREAAAQQAAAAAAAQQQALAKAIADTWNTAKTGARTSAQNYFTERGLDPSQYGGSIDEAIKNALSSVNSQDPNPGAYLKNIGSQVYGSQQDLARERATRGVSSAFAPDYEYGRVASTLDDPFINDIVSGQRSSADQYINNLLKRGVITDTGAQAGFKNLDEQTARVRGQVSDIGSNLLEGERSSLRDIINRGKANASTINLGQTFDPSTYTKQADTSFDEFMAGLGDKIRAQTPDKLFDTTPLASIAGAAQGAQNLAFDPNALAGILNADQVDPVTGKKKIAPFSF